ncbi:MAG: NAD-dependent epimerase/dehydratase family protein [Gemmatimonadales bacterium]|jgi:nucleoside-diphosphate-sugar epimerase|nr:MAG: NAD-dependent epimerase/dehydratase family protein [Gemmatimonadales bacterium]
MAHALVIGGTSLIGRPLVEALLARGDAVTILHRSPGTPFGGRVEELLADRNDGDAVRSAVAGRSFDTVFDNVYDWARGTSSEQVIATARAVSAGARRYVFTSSVAVYPEGGVFDEDAELLPADHPNVYGAQKAESERALFELGQGTGLAVSTLRPAFVYGPHNPFEREAFFWDRLVAGRPILLPEDGRRTMQWVHAADVARAAVLAATVDAGAGRAFNLAGDPITQGDYVRLLASAAGLEAELVPVPRERIQAAGGELLAPPLYFGAYLDVPPITVSGARARELLGLELTPLEEGLRETFLWYRVQERPAPDLAWEDRLLESVGGV